jgi:hypothetical protein
MAAVRDREVWLRFRGAARVRTVASCKGRRWRGLPIPDGALLAVWGTNVAEGDFLPQVKKQISRDEKEGWKFTYRRLTREWASYSGIKDDQIRYVRGITVCDDRAAMFLIDYSRDQKIAYDPVVTRMVRSLKSEDC